MEVLPRIEPQYDEPAAAYHGRLEIALGITSDIDFQNLARQYLSDSTSPARSISKLEQLAAFAGMSPAGFARQHSMLGIFRLVVPAKDWAPFGSRNRCDDAGYVPSRGMLVHKPEVCLCRQCVQEDLDRRKFSWFRRSHQIDGVTRCPLHKIKLHRVTASDPWSRLPQHWVELGDVAPILAEQECETEFEVRYAKIGMFMLEQSAPFSVQTLASVLSARAQSLGLRVSRSGRRMNLSDLLKQTASSHWVETHWPNVARKAPGEYVMGLDRVVANKNYPQRGISYLTAMASMWESPLELIQELTKVRGVNPQEVKALPKLQVRSSEFWQGSVWDAYLRYEGNVPRMASALGIDRTYLARRLPDVGLVGGLKRYANSPEMRAFLRFEAGENLSRACEEERVDIDEVLALIRIPCARQATAVRKINDSRGSWKSVNSGRNHA